MDLQIDGAPATPPTRKHEKPPKYWFNSETRVYCTWIRGLTAPWITTEDEHKNVIRQYSNFAGKPSTINELARALGWSRDIVIGYLKAHDMTHDREPFSAEELMERDDDDLVNDALQMRRGDVAKALDAAKWEQIQRNSKAWEAWEHCTLEPLIKACREGGIGRAVPRVRIGSGRAPFAALVPTPDVHYGMRRIDGSSLADARKSLLDAYGEALGDRIPLFGKPDKVILSDVGDFAHVDNDSNTTRKGTAQDVHGDFAKMLVEAADLKITMVEMARQLGPVELYDVPGNHDPNAAAAIAAVVRARYHDAKDVTIAPYAVRQYATYGITLMGFTHDAKCPANQSLGNLMATECPLEWATHRRRAWFTGHLHHLEAKDQGKVKVYKLPASAGVDRFTHNGKYDAERLLPYFIVDRAKGIVDHGDCEVC